MLYLGKFITEFSIHGQLGSFYHATLDVYHNMEGFPHAAEKSYIEYVINQKKKKKTFSMIISGLFSTIAIFSILVRVIDISYNIF